MILVLRRGAFPAAAALRGLAFFVPLTEEVRVFSFAFTVFVFALFALDESFREPVDAALLEFLRGAIFLREVFLFLVFLLVAMTQVYHCAPEQFIFKVAGHTAARFHCHRSTTVLPNR
jgi:hypothetical protein